MLPLSVEIPVQPDRSQQAFAEKKVDGKLEDIWSKLIADIRAK
jgi:hypothetical protein